MIIEADSDGMAADIGHAGGGLKTMLDAMEVPSHARDLLLQLNSQRTKGFLCDVIIVVQNALFRAHKNILAASSLYLKSLVVHDNLINLDHEMVSPGVFRVILDYIYTGRLSEGDPASPNEPNLGAVLAAASYLQLLDLVALCKKKLKRNGKYPPRTTPAFLPYAKMGGMGLGGGGRYRISTPVIQSCPPGGMLNSHTPRPPLLEELIPHRLAVHAGELYAPTSTQGPQPFPSMQSVLPAQLGLRSALPERNCSPNYGLDLSKKSPNSQSQHTPSQSHVVSTHNDEERDGTPSGRASPTQGTNGRAFPSEKMETSDQTSSLTPPPFPHNQPLGPHLPHLHRSGSQGTERYPCPPSPDTLTEVMEAGREVGNIYRWVKHEPLPYAAEDEDEDEDEEEGGENGERRHNNHKDESEGPDDKSGSGTEETGSSEGRPSPSGPLGRFHVPYEPESYGDNLYVCIPCDKGFPSSEQLNAHVETHTEEELYSNTGGELGNGNIGKNISSSTNGYGGLTGGGGGGGVLSGLSLETKSNQSLASGTIGEMIRPYRCSSCDKSYKDPATLRQHEKTHWLTRPYPCSICGKKFTQRGTMTRHMRSHLGLKPFACDSCGMRFTRQYRLTEHMRIHSGEKPYECQVCGGKFAQQRNLISHMKMHTGGGGGGLTSEGKLKLDFAEGIYPLSKYTAEHLGLKQEKANELLLQAQQQLVADAKAMENLYPLSKLASEHLGALGHDKMDVLCQALPPPQQALSEARTIERYSPS
ncbi:hypermethylated in cancer 1 protein [Syngnathus scovelli]|uniref:hypermethylated in cancer 1 protein n=1 Tax=Syngnathus scovelli TaxID=161590 RepID=UPI002110257C|nr:hypermethylated in cancer 1 protein [Syngnathus scovelli]